MKAKQQSISNRLYPLTVDEISDVLKLIPMRMMAEIAQTARNSFNWYGRHEYRLLWEEAETLAKQWDENYTGTTFEPAK